MSSLAKDLLRIKDGNGKYTDYHILEVESGKLFEPSKYDLKINPSYYNEEGIDICVHKGYCGIYEISDSRFILKNLYTRQDSIEGKLKNIYPVTTDPTKGLYQRLFNYIYRGVNIDFSNFKGSIILGRLVHKETGNILPIEDGIDSWKKKYNFIGKIIFKPNHEIEFVHLYSK